MERSNRLYTISGRITTLIRTKNVDSQVGSRPLPWGAVMSKEEKGKCMALSLISLTHMVGRDRFFEFEKLKARNGSDRDPASQNRIEY